MTLWRWLIGHQRFHLPQLVWRESGLMHEGGEFKSSCKSVPGVSQSMTSPTFPPPWRNISADCWGNEWLWHLVTLGEMWGEAPSPLNSVHKPWKFQTSVTHKKQTEIVAYGQLNPFFTTSWRYGQVDYFITLSVILWKCAYQNSIYLTEVLKDQIKHRAPCNPIW